MFFIRTFLHVIQIRVIQYSLVLPIGVHLGHISLMLFHPFPDNLPDSLNTGIPNPPFSPSLDVRLRGTTIRHPDMFNQALGSPVKIGYKTAAQTLDVRIIPLTPPARSYPNFYNLDDHKMDLAMVILVW